MSILNLNQLQLEFYQELKNKGRTTNTVKNYKTDLDCFNEFLEGQKAQVNLESFDAAFITEFSHYLERRYSSSNSIRRRVQTLRIFFDFLMSKGLFRENPVRKIPTSPKHLSAPSPTSLLEVKTLWELLLTEQAHAKDDFQKIICLRNQIIFLLIYTSALKVSDLHHLKLTDIILDDSADPRVLISPNKRDPYTVPIHPIFKEVFSDYQSSLQSYFAKNNLDSDYLLFNANAYKILKGNLGPRGIEILFQELKKKVDIHLTPKSLRQSAIFLWLSQRHPESLIKEWLGVSPSYSFKNFKDHLKQNSQNSSFLQTTYKTIFRLKYQRT